MLVLLAYHLGTGLVAALVVLGRRIINLNIRGCATCRDIPR